MQKDKIISILSNLKIFFGLGFIILFGTSFYMFHEHWNLIDSLFMSITTLTTVGYMIVHPLSKTGIIFTMLYIIFGVTLFLFFAAEFAKHIIKLNFERILIKRTMETKLKKLKNHYILCGYGRTGTEIAWRLKRKDLEFVVIDKNPEIEENLKQNGYNYIIDDAADDKVLMQAGIDKAKGIFCTLSDDVDNLYLTLSAKNIKPDLKIITRCVKAQNEEKFKKTGATNVILPYEISGRRMVESVIKPMVVDFLDVIMHTKDQELELEMEQFSLTNNSILIGETIVSSHIRQKSGVIIIAIERNGKYIINPESSEKLERNDNLLILGTRDQLLAFEKLVFTEK